MLRSDPDVVMVGEIRDHETAKIGIEAALTGRLVLTTLHTNDAASAVTRLTEMGVERYLVASSIECVVASRLARKLCVECRKPMTIDETSMREAGYADYRRSSHSRASRPLAARVARNTGYRGRTGIFEVLSIDDEIRELLLERFPAKAIEDAAREERHGDAHTSLRLSVCVRASISLAEAARVTSTD